MQDNDKDEGKREFTDDSGNDIRITDDKMPDGTPVKVVEIKSPYARPAVQGVMTPAILAILAIGIVGSTMWPLNAGLFAIGNGIASLGWFLLYKASSSAAAKYFNQMNLQRAMYAAEADMMRQYVTGIVKKIQGNLTEEKLSNKESEGKLEGESEPE